MEEVRKVCLDCGKVAVHPPRPDRAGGTKFGLCEECYQKWLKRDPELTRWAFEDTDEDEQA